MINHYTTDLIPVHDIEMFLSVAQHGSISAAAQDMFISQSSLSKKMSYIESKLGKKLFERSSVGVSLTDSGIRLYSSLHIAYHRFRVAMNAALNDQIYGRSTDLRIGGLHMNEVITAMHNVCNSYNAQHPSSEIFIEYYSHEELYSMLHCHELDAIFTLSFEMEDQEELSSIRLSPVNFRFVFPSSWNIKKLDDDTCRFLSGKPILTELHNGYGVFREYCRANRINTDTKICVSSFLKVMNMVSNGEGFTLWGDTLPEIITERGGISVLDAQQGENCPQVYVSLSWLKGNRVPGLQQFISCAPFADKLQPPSKPFPSLSPNW